MQLLDSLQKELRKNEQRITNSGNNSVSLADSTHANILYEISEFYWGRYPVKGIDYAQKCLSISEKIN